MTQFGVGNNQFRDCSSLVSVANRAFLLLRAEIAVPEIVKVALMLNRLPKFAQIRLRAWYHEGRTRPTRMGQLVNFAKDVDDLYKEVRKPTPAPELTVPYLPDIDSFERPRKRKRSTSLEP